MFFTAINQMMTEGVDLTLVIRKANGQMAVSVLPKSNGLKDEAQNHIIPLTLKGSSAGTGYRIPASRRPAGAESHGTDHQHGAVRGTDGKGRFREQGGEGCKGQGDERGERETGEVREASQES